MPAARLALVFLATFAGCRAGGLSAPDAAPGVPGPTGNLTFDADALLGGASMGPGANAALQALAGAISAASAATGVGASVLAGVVWSESRGDPAVAGGGLMQLGEREFAAQAAAHAQVKGPLTDADANVMAGAFYLLQLQAAMVRRFARGDLGITLRAYNSGEFGVDPTDLSHLPAGTGTTAYVEHTVNYARIVATGLGSLPP